MKRLFSPMFFLVAAAMFFLPFVTVSCNTDFAQGFGEGLSGEPTTGVPDKIELKATGWDLVTGSEPEGAEAFEELGQELEGLGGGAESPTAGASDTEPSLFAIVAFGAAVVGLLLSFLPGMAGGIAAGVLGLVGAVSLYLLRNDISGDLPAELGSFLQVKYEIGYWLAMLFLVLALAAGVWMAMSSRAPAVPAYGMPPPGGTGMPPPPAATTGPPGGPPSGPPPSGPPPSGPPPSVPPPPQPEPPAPPPTG